MMGYGVSAEQLRSGHFSLKRSSLMAMERHASDADHDFVRGNCSFGHCLHSAWLQEKAANPDLQPLEVVPSPLFPSPSKGYTFFDGGFTVLNWCDSDALAIQVELSADLRRPGARHKACVRSLASAVEQFCEEISVRS